MDMQLLLKLMNTLGQMRQHQSWTRSQLEAYQAGELLRLKQLRQGHDLHPPDVGRNAALQLQPQRRDGLDWLLGGEID